MSRPFGRERPIVTQHVRNVFLEGELDPKSVRANLAHTAADGKIYQVSHYNANAIISVGYRAKSVQGSGFRRWAARTLRDHLVRARVLSRSALSKISRCPGYGI
jgi:hypothetical protein